MGEGREVWQLAEVQDRDSARVREADPILICSLTP